MCPPNSITVCIMQHEDTIFIVIENCSVPLFVGIYDHEKPSTQPVIISLKLRAALSERYDDLKAKDVTKVIDYDKLYRFLTESLPKLGHVPLLESLGETIIRFCFEDTRVLEAQVRLSKPQAFKGDTTVGIEMHRTRRAA